MLKSLSLSPLNLPGMHKIDVSCAPTDAMSPPDAPTSLTTIESSESDVKGFPPQKRFSPPPPAAYGTDDDDTLADEADDTLPIASKAVPSTELCLRPTRPLPAPLCSLVGPLEGMPLTSKAKKDLLALVSLKAGGADCIDGPRRVTVDPVTVINALLSKARHLDDQLRKQTVQHKDEHELLLAQSRAQQEKEALDADLLREIMAALREERKNTQTLSIKLQEQDDDYRTKLQAMYRQLEDKEHQLTELTSRLQAKEAEFAEYAAKMKGKREAEQAMLHQHLQQVQEHAIAEASVRKYLEKELSFLREAQSQHQQQAHTTSNPASRRPHAPADALPPLAWGLEGDSSSGTPDSLASPPTASPPSPLLTFPVAPPYSTPVVEPAFEEFVAALRGEEEARLRALEALSDHDLMDEPTAPTPALARPPGFNGHCEEEGREMAGLKPFGSGGPHLNFHGGGINVNTPPRRAMARQQEYDSFIPSRNGFGPGNVRSPGHASSPNKTATRDPSNPPPGYFAKRCRWGVLCRNVTCRYGHPPRRAEIGLAGQIPPQHEEEH